MLPAEGSEETMFARNALSSASFETNSNWSWSEVGRSRGPAKSVAVGDVPRSNVSREDGTSLSSRTVEQGPGPSDDASAPSEVKRADIEAVNAAESQYFDMEAVAQAAGLSERYRGLVLQGLAAGLPHHAAPADPAIKDLVIGIWVRNSMLRALEGEGSEPIPLACVIRCAAGESAFRDEFAMDVERLRSLELPVEVFISSLTTSEAEPLEECPDETAPQRQVLAPRTLSPLSVGRPSEGAVENQFFDAVEAAKCELLARVPIELVEIVESGLDQLAARLAPIVTEQITKTSLIETAARLLARVAVLTGCRALDLPVILPGNAVAGGRAACARDAAGEIEALLATPEAHAFLAMLFSSTDLDGIDLSNSNSARAIALRLCQEDDIDGAAIARALNWQKDATKAPRNEPPTPAAPNVIPQAIRAGVSPSEAVAPSAPNPNPQVTGSDTPVNTPPMLAAPSSAPQTTVSGNQYAEKISDSALIEATIREVLGDHELSGPEREHLNRRLARDVKDAGLQKIGGDGQVRKLMARVVVRLELLHVIPLGGARIEAASAGGDSAERSLTVALDRSNASSSTQGAHLAQVASEQETYLVQSAPLDAGAPPSSADEPAETSAVQNQNSFIREVAFREKFIHELAQDLKELMAYSGNPEVRTFVKILQQLIKELELERSYDLALITPFIPVGATAPIDDAKRRDHPSAFDGSS